jgi:excisionase family DNA binding protein
MSAGLETDRETPTNSNASRRDSEALGALFNSRNSLHGGNSRTGEDALSRLLTVEDVAVLLNVPRKWVYRRVGLKPPEGIPYLKVGKYLRFRESDLREYVERLRRN